MTVATGYLGKREFHGPLAKHSPYSSPGVMCYWKGWRPPDRL
jgi:hypothetical protein